MAENIKQIIESKGNPNGLEAIVKKADLRKTKANAVFVSGVLMDNTGEIDFTVWDQGSTMDSLRKSGNVIILNNASFGEYQGKPQLTVKTATSIPPERAVAAGIIPASPVPVDALRYSFDKIVNAIEELGKDTGFGNIRAVVESMNGDGSLDLFMKMPAGKSMHHEYIYGLLEHSTQVARIAYNTCKVYEQHPSRVRLNIALLLTGALWHDIGKLDEYTVGSLGLVEDYSLEGGLATHMVTGAERVRKMYDSYLTDLEMSKLRHIVLSHHGNLEWGAVVEPAFFEAFIVHHADMIDSSRGPFLSDEYPEDQMWFRPFGRSRMLNTNVKNVSTNIPDV